MAFKDLTKVMYDGKIKLDYLDKPHRYYIRHRENWNLSETDKKAWGKATQPTGVTTILDNTLEKKGLMTWPMGLALRELFGFYDFTNEKGDHMTGFSKNVGTFWKADALLAGQAKTQESLLPMITSASKAWQRKQKKGADIGSVVHDAIEHYIKGNEFDIPEAYNWAIKEAFPIPKPGDEDPDEAARNLAFEEAPTDIEMATKAFNRFKIWWLEATPTLHSAEEILYSMEYNYPGTYDADLSVPTEKHPIFSASTENVPVAFAETYNKVQKNKLVRCTTDWKTSNASTNPNVAAPEGVYYSYFIQDAFYELIRREMGQEPADDLLVVSARKDGEFSLVYASECGLTVDDCLEWAKAVILCFRLMKRTKAALVAHATEPQSKINDKKEAF